MPRLILDFVIRGRRQFALWAFILVAGWPMAFLSPDRDATALAVSMAAAFCAGPLLVRRLVTREVFALPVSARQLWLAKWWAGTVVAAACTTLPKLVFVAVHGLPFVLLSLLCDVAYTGVCFALWPLFDIRPRGPLWFRAAAIRGGMIAWVLTIGGGAVAWPFVLRPILPTQWGDLAGAPGLVMLVALALTLHGYLHQPATGAPREAARTRGSEPVRRGPIAARPLTPVRVAGVAFLLWKDARVALAYATVVVGGMFAVSFVERPTSGFSGILDHIARVLVPRPGEFFGRSGWIVLWIACFPAGLFWHAVLRHVRTLPISAAQIVALIVAIPLARWLALWLVLSVLFILDGRTPIVMRLDTLTAFVGISASIQAVGLRWNNVRRTAVVAGVLAGGWGIVALGISFFAGIEAAAAGLGLSAAGFVGIVTVTAASALNYDTLTRRSLTYRSPAIGYDALTPGLS